MATQMGKNDGQPPGTKTVVFIVSKSSALMLYKFVLEYYCKKTEGDVFLVTDKSFRFNINLNNLVIMEGNQIEIPLKKQFVDIVIALDPPKPELLHDTIAEFHRVVKDDGLTGMGYPHIEEQEDPLSIGAFVERIQYGLKNFPDEETINSTFKKYFRNIKSLKTASFTFFTGKGKITVKK